MKYRVVMHWDDGAETYWEFPYRWMAYAWMAACALVCRFSDVRRRW